MTPASRRFTIFAIVGAGVVPVILLLALRAFDVPLGQPGKFTYLYSELAQWRLRSVPAAAVIAGSAAIGVMLLARRGAALWGGCACVVAAIVALAAWTYFAPPEHVSQHVFNFKSPSHDGAFVNEARLVRDVPEYLARFPQRARTPAAEMRGTRIISNPPGATLLAIAAARALDRSATLRSLTAAAIGEDELPPRFLRQAQDALAFAWLLLLMWLGGAAFLYLAGREYLSREAAAAFAICGFGSAATLLFAPGKDTAQLLTVALPLWLWLRGVRRDSPIWAFAAGVAFIGGCLLSLVHVWIAAIVVVATFGPALRSIGMLRRLALRQLAPALLAAALTAIGLYFFAGINLPAIARAVSASQAAVTRTAVDAMPLAWQLLGGPLFLLFCGPAVWCAAGAFFVRRTRPREGADGGAALGAWLFAATALVMIATIGFTNAETPRLWIPFVPLLLLGAALRLPALRESSAAAGRMLALLVLVQVLAAAGQWALMDMREAEMRLILRTPDDAPRLFD